MAGDFVQAVRRYGWNRNAWALPPNPALESTGAAQKRGVERAARERLARPPSAETQLVGARGFEPPTFASRSEVFGLVRRAANCPKNVKERVRTSFYPHRNAVASSRVSSRSLASIRGIAGQFV